MLYEKKNVDNLLVYPSATTYFYDSSKDNHKI